jgi:acyl carrier protein
MVPALFVPLESFPLTTNGKVDRRALPEPEASPSALTTGTDQDFADELEALIGQLWRDALGATTIGRQDNFFDLGGHSLLIVQVHKQLRAALGREFPVTLLFKHSTVAALASALREKPANAAATAATASVDAARERAQRQQVARQRRRPGGFQP